MDMIRTLSLSQQCAELLFTFLQVTQTPAGGAANTLLGFNSDYIEADNSLNFHMEGAGQTVGTLYHHFYFPYLFFLLLFLL